MSNWFILTVGVLQCFGAAQSIINGQIWFGVLYFLYGLTNFVLFKMQL